MFLRCDISDDMSFVVYMEKTYLNIIKYVLYEFGC